MHGVEVLSSVDHHSDGVALVANQTRVKALDVAADRCDLNVTLAKDIDFELLILQLIQQVLKAALA